MVHVKNRIPYWIDRSLTGLAGPDYDASISIGLPFEPEDSRYGEYRLRALPVHKHGGWHCSLNGEPWDACFQSDSPSWGS